MATVSIPLSQGKVALIDAEDYPLVASYKWFAHVSKTGNTYAHTNVTNEAGKRTTLTMHRLLLEAKTGELVDHRNGDGLDNRRSNIRKATAQQNARNRRKYRATTAPYRGITWNTFHRKWQPQLCIDGKRIHLGYFDDPKEAAMAYDQAACTHFGEFAFLNFPNDANRQRNDDVKASDVRVG